MPEPPPHFVAESAGDPAESLSGQPPGADTVDRILSDFRAWLENATTAESFGESPSLAESGFDLAALLAPFIALRHEVNLLTRASRAQLEQNTTALDQLRQALDVLRRPPPAGDEPLRPLLKALLDVHDALSLGRREVQRLQDSFPEGLASSPAFDIRLPWWARWLGLQGEVDDALAPLRTWLATSTTAD